MYQKKDDKRSGEASPADPGTPKLTPVSELGEFGLIDRLTQHAKIHHPETLKGIGDDAAVIDLPPEKPDSPTAKADGTTHDTQPSSSQVLLVSTDLLMEGIHFDMTYTPLKHLGYKSVAVNASDIAAMNGIPKQLTVSIAASSRYPVEALDELYEGILAACDHYKIDLVGGDTSASVTGLAISVTVLGTAQKAEVVYRNGAKPGDLICVTGDLGSAYIGLLLLEREKKVFQANPNMQPQLQGYDYQIGRFLKPEARIDMRLVLEGLGIRPTAMIDISDGLASEILHLCKQSETGCRIMEDKIPIDPQSAEVAKEFKIIPSVTALSGGEDYELLFTIPATDRDKLREVTGISIIGEMTLPEAGKIMVTPDGKEVAITAQGWKAF